MNLSSLLRALPAYTMENAREVEITHVTSDSRQVTPGALFVAYPGLYVDGARFIPDALQRGAAAIVTQSLGAERRPPPRSRGLATRAVGGAISNLQSLISNLSKRSRRSSERSGEDGDPAHSAGQSPISNLQSPISNLQSLISNPQAPVPVVTVPDARVALAHLAAAWHDFPSRKLRIVGVTGTDGKTTTCMLIASILAAAGRQVGTVTTVAATIGERQVDTGLHTTTPDATEVQRFLADMVNAGMEYAVVEATSEGLAQRRLDAVEFDVAVVTNITHEHLYFHKTWENYRDAKAMLFRSLATSFQKPDTGKVAVLNADDNERGVYDYLSGIACDEQIVYSATASRDEGRRTKDERRATRDDGQIDDHASRIMHHDSSPLGVAGSATFIPARGRGVCDPHPTSLISRPSSGACPEPSRRVFRQERIYARAIEHSARGLRFTIMTPQGELPIESPLLGRYNVSNILAAIGTGMALRVPFDAMREGVARVRGVVGRMQVIQQEPLTAIVDFAHTPNALRVALETAREITPGRVIVVFGCAGLRDVDKRAWMGEIAGRLADQIIVTAEDPRTEDLGTINAQIAEGLTRAGRREKDDYWIVDDRAEAIAFAVNLARNGDLVITCGKGHERSMCYGTTEYPWSDQEALSAALQERRI